MYFRMTKANTGRTITPPAAPITPNKICEVPEIKYNCKRSYIKREACFCTIDSNPKYRYYFYRYH